MTTTADLRTSIRAVYVGRSINIAKAHTDLFPGLPRRTRRDFLLVSFPSGDELQSADPLTADAISSSSSSSRSRAKGGKAPPLLNTPLRPFGSKHMVVFNYGSVVFFGFEESEIAQRLYELAPLVGTKHVATSASAAKAAQSSFPASLFPPESAATERKAESRTMKVVTMLRKQSDKLTPKQLKQQLSSSSASLPTSRQTSLGDVITEDYTIVERPHLREPCVLRNDLTILKELDLHSATVIATVMAQTVALDHYSALTDTMLEQFSEMNLSVEKTGKLKATEKHELFKLVAANNSVLIAVLGKLSLLERSDEAWQWPAYVHVWEGLREEFEIEERFSNLKYKLELIQDNTKFFIEIAHANHSNFLEWIIIVLIATEIVIGSIGLLELKPQDLLNWLSLKMAGSNVAETSSVATELLDASARHGTGLQDHAGSTTIARGPSSLAPSPTAVHNQFRR